MINVHLIRAFEGPRHARLERIWKIIAEIYADRATVWVHDNLTEKKPHATMLEAIWQDVIRQEQEDVIITEFDFLPAPGWLDPRGESECAEYCTRDPYSRTLQQHGLAAPWWMHFVHLLPSTRSDLSGGFQSGGRFNDPCGELLPAARRAGCSIRLLSGVDGYPVSYGVSYPGRGTHLFWSRHYNDPPVGIIAGVLLGEMQRKVDRVLDEYERTFEACHKLA